MYLVVATEIGGTLLSRAGALSKPTDSFLICPLGGRKEGGRRKGGREGRGGKGGRGG